MERKLATIEQITNIKPIPDADKIVIAEVRGWQCVVGKDQYNIGDKVIFCEIDSFLPIKPEYEFLRKGCYRKLPDGSEGFRIKSVKLRKTLSQGLVLPLTIEGDIGDDVTSQLGIIKYDPPLPACLSGVARGNFPSFIPKTDAERIQNAKLGDMWGTCFDLTEKIDGSSVTYYLKDGHFGVCSRNLELIEDENNSYWQAARMYDIERKLREMDCNIAIQGELIGPGIQGNYYKKNKLEIYFFNVYNIDTGMHCDSHYMQNILDMMELQMAPKITINPDNMSDIRSILATADAKSTLADVDREGIVFRSTDGNIKLKAISNRFLLNEK